jgi:hypothetical protein
METKLEQIVERARERGKRKLAAAYANDAHTIDAVSAAIGMSINIYEAFFHSLLL